MSVDNKLFALLSIDYFIDSVMLPVWTMYMTMFHLFPGGITHIGHGHIKIELNTCQRWIGVNRDRVAFHVGYGNENRCLI